MKNTKVQEYSKDNDNIREKERGVILQKVTREDILSYIKFSSSNKRNSNYSFNDFINDHNDSKSGKVIIADLSNLVISSEGKGELLDLSKANFIGSIFHNTHFISCNLEYAKFCGAELDNVFFKESNINFMDLRYADLRTCHFDDSYSKPPWNIVEGIKLSSTASCIRIYADIKNEIAKENEYRRLLNNKRIHLDVVKSKTPLLTKLGVAVGFTSNTSELEKVQKEYKALKSQKIEDIEFLINTSFRNIFHQDLFQFDPILLPGESYCSDNIKKRYFHLSRNNLIDYLDKVKQNTSLSLNDYAKELYVNKVGNELKLDKSLVIITDLSSKINMFGNNEWNRVDLSGLDFSGTDLAGANFSGSNLKNCNFTNCNISGASFESSLLAGAKFSNVKALKSNFYNSNLSNAKFEDSELTGSIITRSQSVGVVFHNVKADFISARNSIFRQARFEKVVTDYSDFSKTDFRGAKFKDTEAKYTIFNRSFLSNTYWYKCILNKSLFNRVVSIHTILDNCTAQYIEAKNSDFTGSKFSDESKFENSDFSYSILDGVKAPMAHFTNVILDHVKVGYSKFADSCFENASFKFSDLNSCVMSESNCKNADFTGAKLYNLVMARTNLKDSKFVGTNIKESNFTNANFEDSDWRNVSIVNSILENINNHRIHINDNTEIRMCQYRDLEGQFYHYDEDDFMDIMFIEQLESNIQKIINAHTLKKLGILSFLLRWFVKGYNISRQEVNKLYNYKLHNKKELKKHFRSLISHENHGEDLRILRIKNNLVFESSLKSN